MVPGRAMRSSSFFAARNGSFATLTDRKSVVVPSRPSRYSFRQRNTWLAFTSCRRATLETETPVAASPPRLRAAPFSFATGSSALGVLVQVCPRFPLVDTQLESLKQWLEEILGRLSKKSDTAVAVCYAL